MRAITLCSRSFLFFFLFLTRLRQMHGAAYRENLRTRRVNKIVTKRDVAREEGADNEGVYSHHTTPHESV